MYNDNKGIKMTLVFTPLPPPPKDGKRRRSNAKAPSVTKINYFHEDFALQDLISKAVHLLERLDLIEGSWLYQGRELDNEDSFSLCYTIPHHVTEQVVISGDADFKQMIEEVTNKAVAKVKLFLMVNKVCPSHFSILLVQMTNYL
jgi:hypothetical protein